MLSYNTAESYYILLKENIKYINENIDLIANKLNLDINRIHYENAITNILNVKKTNLKNIPHRTIPQPLTPLCTPIQ